MRRFIALILMLIVPLQFAWSAAAVLYGHSVKDVVAVGGFHAHAHDHDVGHADHDLILSGEAGSSLMDGGPMDSNHNDDGHHGGHCHHVLSLILPGSGLMSGQAQADGPILRSPAAFLSRTPPLLDRPPLAFA
jgi:hypothetical protein